MDRHLRIGKVTLFVGEFPYRKKPVLAIVEGNTASMLASFRDNTAAEIFIEALRHAFEDDDESRLLNALYKSMRSARE